MLLWSAFKSPVTGCTCNSQPWTEQFRTVAVHKPDFHAGASKRPKTCAWTPEASAQTVCFSSRQAGCADRQHGRDAAAGHHLLEGQQALPGAWGGQLHHHHRPVRRDREQPGDALQCMPCLQSIESTQHSSCLSVLTCLVVYLPIGAAHAELHERCTSLRRHAVSLRPEQARWYHTPQLLMCTELGSDELDDAQAHVRRSRSCTAH